MLEVAAAGGEDDPVGLDGAPLAGERHVHEVLVQLQVAEGHHDVRLVVVPFQAKLVRSHPKGTQSVRARVGVCVIFVWWIALLVLELLFASSYDGGIID